MIASQESPETAPAAASTDRGIRRSALLAVPSCLAALTVALVIGAALTTATREARVERYSRQGRQFLQERNDPAARICFERLLQLEPARPEHLFGLAVALERLGQPRRAEALAWRLAPPDRPGHSAARLWLGRRLAALAGRNLAAARGAERQLRMVPDADPLSAEAHEMLGTLFLTLGQADFAERDLKKARPERPEIKLLLTQAYLKQGRTEAARDAAREAANQFRARLSSDPGDVPTRLGLAAAIVLQEHFQEAEEILAEGIRRGEDPRIERCLASLYTSWSDAMARDGRLTPADRVKLLERGLRHDPGNEAILLRLVRLIQSGGPGADSARTAVHSLLSGGKASPGVDFVLGIDAWERGRRDEARRYWEHALERAPRFAAAANNLAWLLATDERPALERALKLAEIALDELPDSPMYGHTRAHVLLKLGRWSDALAGLEAVLATGTDVPGLHDSLAVAYDHLGDPALAAEHRRLEHRRAR